MKEAGNDYSEYAKFALIMQYLQECGIPVPCPSVRRVLRPDRFSSSVLCSRRGGGDFTEKYDENTEITVRGVIMDAGRETRGPLILRVQHAGRTYLIVTAPPWYLVQESALFRKGMEIEARGSKYFGNDGNLYLLAKEIREMPGGKVTVMRDKQYRPLWHGRRMPARGRAAGQVNPVVARKGGAKRLKALLKATIRLVSFVFQDSTLCVIDHWRIVHLSF
ncbi:MAG: hypothetical protein MZU95_09870 [Desulfomicrobium escambiense]|nr:hypothetical protein [Desulfomicrobium escambiense]